MSSRIQTKSNHIQRNPNPNPNQIYDSSSPLFGLRGIVLLERKNELDHIWNSPQLKNLGLTARTYSTAIDIHKEGAYVYKYWENRTDQVYANLFPIREEGFKLRMEEIKLVVGNMFSKTPSKPELISYDLKSVLKNVEMLFQYNKLRDINLTDSKTDSEEVHFYPTITLVGTTKFGVFCKITGKSLVLLTCPYGTSVRLLENSDTMYFDNNGNQQLFDLISLSDLKNEEIDHKNLSREDTQGSKYKVIIVPLKKEDVNYQSSSRNVTENHQCKSFTSSNKEEDVNYRSSSGNVTEHHQCEQVPDLIDFGNDLESMDVARIILGPALNKQYPRPSAVDLIGLERDTQKPIKVFDVSLLLYNKSLTNKTEFNDQELEVIDGAMIRMTQMFSNKLATPIPTIKELIMQVPIHITNSDF
jgi:hypothetical protein